MNGGGSHAETVRSRDDNGVPKSVRRGEKHASERRNGKYHKSKEERQSLALIITQRLIISGLYHASKIPSKKPEGMT